MEWSQILTIVGSSVGLMIISIGTTISMFLWARNEAGSDRRDLYATMEEHRKECYAYLEASRLETNQILKGIQEEMKDFHGRLCEIESRRR